MKDTSPHIVCYVPVLHDGYLQLFAAHPDAVIHVLGTAVLSSRFDYLRKDVRALSPELACELLRGIDREATVVKEAELQELLQTNTVSMPDDDISHALAEEFAAKHVTFEPVFLRWDRRAIDASQDVVPDKSVSIDAHDAVLAALYTEAGKSTNWWRTVGAAIVENGTIVALAHNGSVPTAYSSAIDGDPRITERRGVDVDTSIDLHAEARLIAEAAKNGTSLAGKILYATTFPCASCAKLIATSGVTACYYVEGYASIDGQAIMKENGVELVKIEAQPTASSRQRLKPYPKKPTN